MKKIMSFMTVILVASLLSGVFFGFRSSAGLSDSRVSSVPAAASVSEEEWGPHNLIRFHILAHSDGAEDQELKYEVRDAVVSLMGPLLAQMSDLDEARQTLKDSEDLMMACAQDVIAQRGFSYPVALAWDVRDFPTRAYGNVTLPAGEYEAVRILIGDAAGANWWCVLFPPLCFVEEEGKEDEDTRVASADRAVEGEVDKMDDEMDKDGGAKSNKVQKRSFFMDLVKNILDR